MSHKLCLAQPDLLHTQCLIDGQWVGADSSRTLPVTNPATGEILAEVPALGAAETARAIAAAGRAWTGWRSATARKRAMVLRRWYELILNQSEDLARILTAEQGKPLAEARNEIVYAAGFVEWFAEEARRAYGETIPSPVPDKRLLVIRQPIGVCAAITPWNFPAAMVTRKIAPALAAGCTVVVKPAEQTPLTALALAELAVQANFPPGVVNVVTGEPAAIGDELTANPLVRKLSFTGSTEVGRLLMARCAATVKKVSLELGGNAPFIVFEDADLEAAVEGALLSKYRNTGQTCVCANRFLIQESIYDVFAERLAAKVRTLKVGNGLDEGVVQGPLIDGLALAKVERHIADALDKGARVLAGGERHPLGGWFFQPTVLVEVTPEMLCTREETFGPVAPLLRFGSEEEALAIANATEYGLAAYFYTRDLARAFRIGEALEYGMVGVNTGMLSYEVAPFGGLKQSGIGREGSHHGMDEYLELKYLCLGGMAPSA
ncbi:MULTISPECIES: NAD-dependent succinate-semialdehyde dehydrogenase [Methylococcus]|uniref:NAD-dependent succinate-semialdehyde dehydrogenase n=1 Tax=Methylococcus capsulatus TaxID=414 RepID=A0ABZ2F5Z9_METCP|nr:MULTISPECIES: NAD-dependent succinate-semialdehyde dehydrogenase [Methylococcus]MDF9392045.1 NAD-dependent succinate-semialdehyde dehydrogenase [Methylococcus capsulatus]